jgi:hypothetical protein
MPFVDIAIALILVAAIAWFLNTRGDVTGPFRLILNVVLMLIVVGMALWLVNTYIPMAGAIKGILNIVVVVGTCIAVLKAFGIWGDVVKLWTDLTHRVTH